MDVDMEDYGYVGIDNNFLTRKSGGEERLEGRREILELRS